MSRDDETITVEVSPDALGLVVDWAEQDLHSMWEDLDDEAIEEAEEAIEEVRSAMEDAIEA